jgi:hypothetical protein
METDNKIKVNIDVNREKLVGIKSLMKAAGVTAQVDKIVSNTRKIGTKDPPEM